MADTADVSAQVPVDWQAWKAEVDAKLNEIAAKELAAKEKAAGRPSVKVGGRIMVDWAAFSQNADSKAQAGDFQNGTEFRRARIFLAGDAFDIIDYKIQFDFADDETVRNSADTDTTLIDQIAFNDVYFTVRELPLVGHVRVGHFKMPIGLEQLGSSKYMPFMERGLPADLAVEGRRTGVMAFNHTAAENLTWAVGAFVTKIAENPPIFQNDSGGTALAMRSTYLPWYAEDGRFLLHTGIAYAYGDIAGGDDVRLRRHPEAHLANHVVDTGALLDVNDTQLLGLEAAVVLGPVSLQAEFDGFWVNRIDGSSTFFTGAYAYVSYFLTGENRVYRRTTATFTRLHPFTNFFSVRDNDGCVHMGKGAWEVAYRYSFLDLNDDVTIGGYVRDHTIGLNWYLNPYTRLMFNYVNSQTTDYPGVGGAGRADIFEMRCQIDF
jgi:phosphate-selective porin OprO/OprP